MLFAIKPRIHGFSVARVKSDILLVVGVDICYHRFVRPFVIGHIEPDEK